MRRAIASLMMLGALALAACTATSTANQTRSLKTNTAKAAKPARLNDYARQGAFPSTYAPLPAPPTLIENATLYDGRGERYRNTSLLLEDGKITAIGPDLPPPQGAKIINAQGRFVTPGIIDVHSHIGISAVPKVPANRDNNESINPVTPDVWAEHGIWPQDPAFTRALAGGVTTLHILPGSANLIGGRTVTLKNIPARTVQGMKFPGAPYGLKMACGENPKRVYGGRRTAPATRMGNIAGYRKAWVRAARYKARWDKYAKEKDSAPARDLALETLAGVLSGEILLHMHCYRADEMAQLLDVAKEFNYQIGTFHHAVESYKIADLLAQDEVCSAVWADWWGFKMEAYDGIRENAALIHRAGACTIIHSDDANDIQRLNQEAAKAWAAGRHAGFDIAPEEAWTWLSYNAARSLGIEGRTGSLEVGKMADVVIWSGDPFSVYTHTDQVFIDGALVYDRMQPSAQPISDFELGQPGMGDVK